MKGSNYKLSIVIFAICLVATSCSTHRKVKRAEYYRSHHNVETKVDRTFGHSLKGHEKIVVEEAMEWLGTPYTYAMQNKGEGTDCSGMVMVVFDKTIGCQLPRNSSKQSEHCKEIKENKVLPGDLVFFATGSDPSLISHVGIMLDKMNFIHASSSQGVIISSMDTEYYSSHFVKYGRVPCFKH